MFDVAEITAALSTSDDPAKLLEQLDDDELADLHEDVEEPKLRSLLETEMARRKSTSKKSWTGTIVWLVVIALVIGSIAGVVLR